jgi:hypothetical protein
MQLAAESLRISAFATAFADYRQPPLDEWWRIATGAEPEQVNRSAANQQAMAEGPWQSGRLALVATPGRVDWHLTPPPSLSSEWPSIGKWPDSISMLIEPSAKWLGDVQSITRVAFGALVVLPVSDRFAGYRLAEAALSELNLKLPEGLTDFLIQFNLAMPSPIGPAEMKFNRLARWGVALLKQVFLQVAVAAGTPTTVATGDLGRPEFHALRAELDFSTSADWNGALPPEQAVSLLKELANQAVGYVKERVK